MKLTELLEAVKEEHMVKSQLENYHTSLSNMAADLAIELAELKKEKAMFEASDPNKSVAKMKVEWKGTEKGQRLLLLEGYMKATMTQLKSLRNRIYADFN